MGEAIIAISPSQTCKKVSEVLKCPSNGENVPFTILLAVLAADYFVVRTRPIEPECYHYINIPSINHKN